ncbi:MAG: F0F1 ATP synthase subunit B [Deltaproteobacteria bacterium]|nr:F0F1 ATP synthase subunit B [Deltaproteobacteria bacterium]
MTKHLNKVVGFAVSVLFLLLPLAVWAAEEAHQEHGGHTGGGPDATLAFAAINFLLFVFVLRKYALPAVRDSLKRRRETIVQALNEAKKAKEEAEALQREYRQKLAGLAAEQERLRQQAFSDAEREKTRILEEAQKMAERVRTEVQLTAGRELAEARRLLREEVAEQAVRLATELVRSRLTPGDQSRLIQDLVQEVNKNAGNDALR